MAESRSAAQRLYLSVYNWVSFFGWAQVLYYATLALLGGGHETVYAAVKLPLLFSQTAMLTEILHSILGFVRSPVIATSTQVCARTLVTWAIVWTYPETHSHILITSLALSWSITELNAGHQIFILWFEGGIWNYTFLAPMAQVHHFHGALPYWAYQRGWLNLHCHASHEGKSTINMGSFNLSLHSRIPLHVLLHALPAEEGLVEGENRIT
ncbi:very-long-chain (3R)-3-hydroxyacyl-CoA dehydratase PASTICCINO 2A isoform X1 [Setaria viridis]|uniref:very-long-chain (3R)-3-hydroxyacyl-CoA dehydratase PASTICCINO 2A isoform X1 n=1 Tax=Setaria viridis TaxID=4556 RepID=UPI003B3AD3F9